MLTASERRHIINRALGTKFQFVLQGRQKKISPSPRASCIIRIVRGRVLCDWSLGLMPSQKADRWQT